MIYDYAYAGDLKGNVWRFNLTGNMDQVEKIFTTRTGQPITTKIVVGFGDQTGRDPILNFGTGRRQEGYLNNATSFAAGVQSLYGLRDRTAIKFGAAQQIDHSQLQQQTVSEQTGSFVDGNGKTQGSKKLSNELVNWTSQHGWYMNLGSKVVGKDEKGTILSIMSKLSTILI